MGHQDRDQDVIKHSENDVILRKAEGKRYGRVAVTEDLRGPPVKRKLSSFRG